MNLPVIDVAPDMRSVRLMEAYKERIRRRQTVMLSRKHVPWKIRKYQPAERARLVAHFDAFYRTQMRIYMNLEKSR